MRAWVLLAAGCGRGVESADRPELADPPVATDLDPAEGGVEVELVARIGALAVGDDAPELWTYCDGTTGQCAMPGPTIEARVGDTLVVHLRNELDESTTLHLHGLALPAAMDGTMVAQALVAPGDEFTYTVVLQTPNFAWYHPHVSAHRQVERGLYGAISVTASSDPPVTADRVLVLDDLRLAGGEFDDTWTDADLAAGRQSELVLVNGVPAGTAVIRPTGRERWRVLDAANAREFDLSLGSPFLVMGTDGGPLTAPVAVDHLVIAPGQRYDLLVDLPAHTRWTLSDLGRDRGFDIAPEARDLLSVEVGAVATLPPVGTRVAPEMPIAGPDAPVRAVVLGERPSDPSSPMYTINGEFWPFDSTWSGELGSVERWQIENTTAGDQPFHLHGTEFAVPGDPVGGLRDVIVVAGGQTAEIEVPLGEPGLWMFHTHLLEVAEYGMMGEIDVR